MFKKNKTKARALSCRLLSLLLALALIPAIAPMSVPALAEGDNNYTVQAVNDVTYGPSQMPVYAIWDKNTETLTFTPDAPDEVVSGSSDIRSVIRKGGKTVNFVCDGTGKFVMPADCSHLFSIQRYLTNVHGLAYWDTSAVTDMSSMFINCESLTSLDLSGFDTSSVTDMDSMFAECRSLTSLDLSGFDTSAVTDMQEMFIDCLSLTSLDLSSFDTSAVTDMRSMFDGCNSLTSLDAGGFDMSAATMYGMRFDFCHSMRTLILPTHVKTSIGIDDNTTVLCGTADTLDSHIKGGSSAIKVKIPDNARASIDENDTLSAPSGSVILPPTGGTITAAEAAAVAADGAMTLPAGSTVEGEIGLYSDAAHTQPVTFTSPLETKLAGVYAGEKNSAPTPLPSADGATVAVAEAKGEHGQTVEVPVTITNNTGFTDLGIELDYDSSVLTLTGITNNEEVGGMFTGSENFESKPQVLMWNSTENITFNGTLATLTFKINDSAANGTYPINVNYYKGINGDYIDGTDVNYNEDFKPLNLNYTNGAVTVKTHIPGDTNGDGKVTNQDGTFLLRYLAGWDVKIDTAALDINGDGTVNSKDGTLLFRYLAGWNVTIY